MTRNFPHFSPYSFAANNPIYYVDLEGLSPKEFCVYKFLGGSNGVYKHQLTYYSVEEMNVEESNDGKTRVVTYKIVVTNVIISHKTIVDTEGANTSARVESVTTETNTYKEKQKKKVTGAYWGSFVSWEAMGEIFDIKLVSKNESDKLPIDNPDLKELSKDLCVMLSQNAPGESPFSIENNRDNLEKSGGVTVGGLVTMMAGWTITGAGIAVIGAVYYIESYSAEYGDHEDKMHLMSTKGSFKSIKSSGNIKGVNNVGQVKHKGSIINTKHRENVSAKSTMQRDKSKNKNRD